MIYVLLPVHDRRSVTMRFITCLAAQTCTDWHLVLIDDGSRDGTAEAVKASIPGTTVIRGTGHWWWAGSLQQGYRWLARQRLRPDDVVLIANDDTEFGPGFLADGRAAVLRSDRALLLAQLHDRDSGELVEVGVHADWHALTFNGVDDPSRVNCYSTRGLFLRARQFVALGGFHPRLLPHYGSDYEFTLRARRSGYELVTDQRVSLRYDASATGIREVGMASPRGFLRRSLSKRSVSNPIYWSTFVILACPPALVPRNLLRVWRGFLRDLLGSTLSSLR